jgi:hypothetical protein
LPRLATMRCIPIRTACTTTLPRISSYSGKGEGQI